MNVASPCLFSQSPDAPTTLREKLTLNWRGKTDRLPDLNFVEVVEQASLLAEPVAHFVTVAPLDEQSPLQICMNHWRAWMHQSDRDLGAKGQAGLIGGEGASDGDNDSAAASEAAAARASRDIAIATDAMIDSLPRHFKAAIYRSNNIASVWRFPNMDFAVTLPEAELELAAKLAKNIATRAFF